MENLVVAAFQGKDEATQSLSKLTELNEIDDIMIYNIVMIQKKGDRFQILYQEGPDTQDLPAQEAAVGTLIGALAGPLGMGLGMLTGVTAGALEEDDTQTFYDAILEGIDSKLFRADVNPYIAVQMIFGTIDLSLITWILFGKPRSMMDVCDPICELIFNALRSD